MFRMFKGFDGDDSFMIVGDEIEQLIQAAFTHMGADWCPNASARLYELISAKLEEAPYAILACGGRLSGGIAIFRGVKVDAVIEEIRQTGVEVQ